MPPASGISASGISVLYWNIPVPGWVPYSGTGLVPSLDLFHSGTGLTEGRTIRHSGINNKCTKVESDTLCLQVHTALVVYMDTFFTPTLLVV
jgi:hypothetical protein